MLGEIEDAIGDAPRHEVDVTRGRGERRRLDLRLDREFRDRRIVYTTAVSIFSGSLESDLYGTSRYPPSYDMGYITGYTLMVRLFAVYQSWASHCEVAESLTPASEDHGGATSERERSSRRAVLE